MNSEKTVILEALTQAAGEASAWNKTKVFFVSSSRSCHTEKEGKYA